MSTKDTTEHIEKVRANIYQVMNDLVCRSEAHDNSKLEEPELSGYERLHVELTPIAYGTPEYKAKMGEFRWLIEHHFAANDHHPEHHESGVSGMTLMSLIEMLADWKAASDRPQSKNKLSLDWNVERFGIEPQLASILHNTARQLGWIE